ncbi:Plant peroxidase [Corchorus capsularis]|uniref:Peroxidase n=1 Tax=Corchorus capsularis TaxID=210143 RepID=A0A1R3G7P7_COCAP|nr:Plant peroxidase [Corchorus capsularis]
MGKLSFIVFVLCIWISFKSTSHSSNGSNSSPSSVNSDSAWVFQDILLDGEAFEDPQASARLLEYDFYRDICPEAEKIIRTRVHQLFKIKAAVAPALVRLAFHDCFVETGGPFYPLNTGRRDSTAAFADSATNELPSPHADLSETLASFSSKGFDERETVSLLGAHSIGVIHCNFFQNRLYNFRGTHQPDPSLDSEALNQMRTTCPKKDLSASPAPSPDFEGSPLPTSRSPSLYNELLAAPPASFDNLLLLPSKTQKLAMAYDGTGPNFGTVYYRSLLQGKGILYADQQLMAGEETGLWVRAYASDSSLYQRDFALAMMKLSNRNVLTAPRGQIRLNCSRVA